KTFYNDVYLGTPNPVAGFTGQALLSYITNLNTLILRAAQSSPSSDTGQLNINPATSTATVLALNTVAGVNQNATFGVRDSTGTNYVGGYAVTGGVTFKGGLYISGTITGGGGGGTVTTFSAGNLPPLFTTAVVNPTTAPALSFTPTNQNANLVYAGPS